MKVKVKFFFLAIAVFCLQPLATAQSNQPPDTIIEQRKVPERNSINIVLPHGEIGDSTKKIIQRDNQNTQNDVLPNPNTEEGIKFFREVTKKKIIQVDQNVWENFKKTTDLFLKVIAENNEEEFNQVFKLSTIPEKQNLTIEEFQNFRTMLFRKIVNDFNSLGVTIGDFSFGVTYINEQKTILKGIMMDSHGIETTELKLELQAGEWVITRVGY
jgi:hypothetical protein